LGGKKFGASPGVTLRDGEKSTLPELKTIVPS
jgi:hypothetical protein